MVKPIRNSRVHYRRHNCVNTRSNKTKIIRTPGARLYVHYRKKRTFGPRTPACTGHQRLQGIRHLGHMQRKNAAKKELTVSRAYGGVLTHKMVRERVVRAFLIEEQMIVKKVLKTQRRRK
eukprot:NODE_6309_length_549_cov_1374.156398_g6144_i0.p1 GENE.NODE_6309_length_549_cov_1374.156398_g6144_i0~~NODE_6309_length_549_cov_1374.156398_g6144_i0.p1  ORF type:complete len:120 (-),score=12.90 NODE_6309_length_549_cov_1374.156398_g6144_i0:122-481(-)